MHRDSRGRFCKADNDTIYLPMPEIGDIMYSAEGWGHLEGEEKFPPHSAVTAHKVQEIFGNGPVCFPWEYRPNDPMYLQTFEEARKQAVSGTTRQQLLTNGGLRKSYESISECHEYDYVEPEGFTEPQFKIGDWVYAVEFLNMVYLQIIAFKGVIIGQRFEIDKDAADTSATINRGWNYEVYYKKPDEYSENPVGNLIEQSVWVPERSIYNIKEDAITVFLDGANRINRLYGEIFKRLETLKPEDVKLEDRT